MIEAVSQVRPERSVSPRLAFQKGYQGATALDGFDAAVNRGRGIGWIRGYAVGHALPSLVGPEPGRPVHPRASHSSFAGSVAQGKPEVRSATGLGYDGVMSKFMGGSAYSMARDVAEGFVTATERTYKNMSPGDMNQLSHEMERHLRELRGEPTAGEDTPTLQARNRKIMRLNQALTVLRAYRTKARR